MGGVLSGEALFVERFGVNVKEEPLPQVGAYDEDRSLSLEPDGMPTVQSDIVGATNTNTLPKRNRAMPTVARGKTRSQEWGLAQLRNATRTTG